MTTIDSYDLDAVIGGTLAGTADTRTLLPALPRDLPVPKLPQPPSTIPLGPYYPPATPNNIA